MFPVLANLMEIEVRERRDNALVAHLEEFVLIQLVLFPLSVRVRAYMPASQMYKISQTFLID